MAIFNSYFDTTRGYPRATVHSERPRPVLGNQLLGMFVGKQMDQADALLHKYGKLQFSVVFSIENGDLP